MVIKIDDGRMYYEVPVTRKITCVVGEMAVGKSTLLDTLSVAQRAGHGLSGIPAHKVSITTARDDLNKMAGLGRGWG